jgi:1-acyl-sn-glycerol-3-phosphate acyltransferase
VEFLPLSVLMVPPASELVIGPAARAPRVPVVHDWITHGILHALAATARRWIVEIDGLEHVQAARDPFIVAINHNARTEALLVPAALIEYRCGRLIHFLADWNYRLIPGVATIYRRAETITVTRKSARPPILNLLKPLYADPSGPLRRAIRTLQAGGSVGIFPEGKINPDPSRLLPGFRGAAYLSLRARVPIVPVGIRFPHSAPDQPIDDFAPMTVRIGAPMYPTRAWTERLSRTALRGWHATLMREIALLSGKEWPHDFTQRPHQSD